MNERKQKWCNIAWYLVIFGIFYIWFTQVHPLVVFDADDWTYISYVRKATPIWGEWNPSRVFPEVVMPFVSSVAAFGVMPLVGDYMTAQTVTHAFVVSACVTVYVFCFAGLMKRLFQLTDLHASYASALFLILHFLVFRSKEAGNQYLFYCVNLTCYYYYLIPELLASALVMYMVENPKFDAFLGGEDMGKKGLYFLAMYLLIFSNLPASGILAVYAGAKALISLLGQLKTFSLKAYLRQNGLYVLILAAWAFSAVFELSGGRADSMSGSGNSLISGLADALYVFKDTFFCCNRLFQLACFASVGAAAAVFLLTKEKGEAEKTLLNQMVLWVLCAGVMLLYTMILSAKVQISYMSRSEYLFGIFFFGLVLVLVSLSYLFHKCPKLLMAVPILLCVLFFEINTAGVTFQRNTMGFVDGKTAAAVSNDLIAQALAAQEEGKTETVIYVPLWETPDNWPQAPLLMGRLSQALVEHGILEAPMGMTFVPSEEVNVRHGMPIPEISE